MMSLSSPFKIVTRKQFEDKYTMLTVISRGKQGSVSKAQDNNTGQFVAIKEYYTRKNERQQRYMNHETEALNLISHEHVVMILDAFVVVQENCQDDYFLVTELCDGDLGNIKAQVSKTYSLTEKLNLSLNLAKGLEAIHKQNLIHRDLKPENIFFKGNVFKIGDLGLSRQVDFSVDNPSLQMSAVGNVVYCEPEVFTGKYKPKCDIYSMGLIIYEIFMGQHLFTPRKGENTYEMNERFRKNFKGEVSKLSLPTPLLKEIIKGCLEKDYDKRYSAKRLRESLERALQIEEKKLSSISVETSDTPEQPQMEVFKDGVQENTFEVEDLLSKLKKNEILKKSQQTQKFIFGKLKMMEQIRSKMKALEGLSGEKDKKEAVAFSLLFYFQYWAAAMEKVLALKESPFSLKYPGKIFVKYLSEGVVQRMKKQIAGIFDGTNSMFLKMAEEILKRNKLPEEDVYRSMIFDVGQNHCDRCSLLKYTELDVKSFVRDTAQGKLGDDFRRANPDGALKAVRQIVKCFLEEQ